MNRKIIAVIASLVILVAGVCLWRTLRPSAGNQFDGGIPVGVGQVLAEETAKAVQDHGRVVAVIGKAAQESFGVAPTEWATFRTELKKHPGVIIDATEVDPPDTDGMPGCSAAAFNDILERHSQADAIIFFMALPSWHFFSTKVALPPPPTAKIIVMGGLMTSTPKIYYTGYFTSKLLSVLLIGRVAAAPDQIAEPKTPREKFHNGYLVITPANYESLPE